MAKRASIVHRTTELTRSTSFNGVLSLQHGRSEGVDAALRVSVSHTERGVSLSSSIFAVEDARPKCVQEVANSLPREQLKIGDNQLNALLVCHPLSKPNWPGSPE